MTAIRVYSPGDPEHVRFVARDVPFASCDPGNHGALLVWPQGAAQTWPERPAVAVPISQNAGGADIAARACAKYDVRVLLIEDQFFGLQTRNFRTTKKLIFTGGIIVGRIAERVDLDDVVQVAPSTWQAGLPKHSGSKARALVHARRKLPGWIETIGLAPLRSGCADAFGVADWFASEVTRETR